MPYLPEDDSPLEPPLDPFSSRNHATRELVEQLPVVVFVDTDDAPRSTVYVSPNVEKAPRSPPGEDFLEDHETLVPLDPP